MIKTKLKFFVYDELEDTNHKQAWISAHSYKNTAQILFEINIDRMKYYVYLQKYVLKCAKSRQSQTNMDMCIFTEDIMLYVEAILYF